MTQSTCVCCAKDYNVEESTATQTTKPDSIFKQNFVTSYQDMRNLYCSQECEAIDDDSLEEVRSNIIVINDEFPVRSNHVCFFTKTESCDQINIQLFEVVEQFYRHPDAPDDALIPVIETKWVGTYNRITEDLGAQAVLLEAAQNTFEALRS